ncbi:MAG TPA: MFS transporter [Thermoleophilia bacterium]|nr:MFS transporter [Thermoleophilia bacterium]
MSVRPAACIGLADPRTCGQTHPALVSRPASFWIAAAVFLLGMAGGALPTPLYPLYQARWGFSNITVTLVFAVYAAGVLASLLGLGRLSDEAGRRPVLLLAAGLAAASTVVFLLAQGLGWLLVARFLSGLAVGVLTGTATAALAELEPAGDRRRASLAAAMVTPGGVALGIFVAGVLAEYGPASFRLVYAVYLGALAVLVAGVLVLPETVPAATGRFALRAQRPHVPAGMRRPFVVAALGVFAAFVILGLFSSLAPSFLGEALREHNLFIAGSIVAIFFAAAAAAPLVIGHRSLSSAGVAGAVGIVAGLVLVLTGLSSLSLTSFFAGAIVVGFGVGALFVSSLALVNRSAPSQRRGEVVSAYFVAAYTGLTLPVISVGIASEHVGVLTSAEWLSGAVVVLTAVAIAGIVATSRRLDAAERQAAGSSRPGEAESEQAGTGEHAGAGGQAGEDEPPARAA